MTKRFCFHMSLCLALRHSLLCSLQAGPCAAAAAPSPSARRPAAALARPPQSPRGAALAAAGGGGGRAAGRTLHKAIRNRITPRRAPGRAPLAGPRLISMYAPACSDPLCVHVGTQAAAARKPAGPSPLALCCAGRACRPHHTLAFAEPRAAGAPARGWPPCARHARRRRGPRPPPWLGPHEPSRQTAAGLTPAAILRRLAACGHARPAARLACLSRLRPLRTRASSGGAPGSRPTPLCVAIRPARRGAAAAALCCQRRAPGRPASPAPAVAAAHSQRRGRDLDPARAEAHKHAHAHTHARRRPPCLQFVPEDQPTVGAPSRAGGHPPPAKARAAPCPRHGAARRGRGVPFACRRGGARSRSSRARRKAFKRC